jgi:tryptophan synthase alpha chain
MRIDRLFQSRREQGRKVLVAYLCVGDPSLDASLDLCRAALDAGADMLELGVPFSDPTADGPTIARASERAILAGSSFAKTLEIAAKIRAGSDAPLVVFGYYNPIYVYGEARAIKDAARAGVDAFLPVDLPPEEGAEFRDEADREGIAIVPLVTPTSGPDRVAAASKRARGFLYYVSVTGVTGQAAEESLTMAGREAAKLRKTTGLPVVVGFGIDGGHKARLPTAGEGADGVVVGTAIVRAIELGTTQSAREAGVRRVVADIRAGLDAC